MSCGLFGTPARSSCAATKVTHAQRPAPYLRNNSLPGQGCHDGGYLDYYSLVATSKDDAVTVGFVSPADSFTSHVSATDPSWFGTGTAADPNQPRIEFRGGFINPCVYDFDLHARSRLHNGYNHIQWRHRDKGYYVEPVP